VHKKRIVYQHYLADKLAIVKDKWRTAVGLYLQLLVKADDLRYNTGFKVTLKSTTKK
jgi:hypothetical protein